MSRECFFTEADTEENLVTITIKKKKKKCAKGPIYRYSTFLQNQIRNRLNKRNCHFDYSY